MISFLILTPGEYYFTVCQKDKRQFHNKPYLYSYVRMTLCEKVTLSATKYEYKYLKFVA
jgi:hypothetical protein